MKDLTPAEARTAWLVTCLLTDPNTWFWQQRLDEHLKELKDAEGKEP